jgi:hypothetical protein
MNSTIPAYLLELKTRFETWRTNRKYLREPIPNELWNAAAGLSRRYSPSLVSRVLKLDSSKVKKFPQLSEVLARVLSAVRVERDFSPPDLDHQTARLGGPPFLLLPLFVFLQAREDPHPRVIAVDYFSIGGQSPQVEEDGQRRIGHRFTALELHRFRQRDAEAFLQARQPLPGQSRPVLGQGQRNIAGRIALLRPHTRRQRRRESLLTGRAS